MPDLNELLRWSIANSQLQSTESTPSDQQLSLRFSPASSGGGSGTTGSSRSGGNSALHSSDGGLADVSPASTPGPATPVGGSTLPLPPGGELPGAGTSARRDDLTTEMLDLIMGKSDSIVMKEKMDFALDESHSVEDRVEALDDFEMLIELIDNANNMPILKLWDPLLSLLSSPHPEIVAHVCWIIGTAVQNNLKAQAALYIHNAFPQILSILYPSTGGSSSHPSSVRAKATYALSSSLKHWPLASSVLSADSSSGYNALKRGIVDSDPVVRRKMAFLLGTLVMQSGEVYEGEIPNEVRGLLEQKMKEVNGGRSETLVDGMKREGVFEILINALKEKKEEIDVEFEENAMRALTRAIEKDALSMNDKEELKSVWAGWDEQDREDRGLGGEDGIAISAMLGA
ncbi:hypothetical protein IAR55_002849 [Kwoniella newhampshirensis]|uniref:Nucleotide exchange factor Fes1 domain-containing protein n=1 Tax=Kwoniella newhampshirensis TaxID=1651941 RepID=A0AAW0YXT7_9TREE